jgi:hypothetical protein
MVDGRYSKKEFMNPLFLAALGVGALVVLKKSSGTTGGVPNEALIAEVKGMTPIKNVVPPGVVLTNGATQYKYTFSKGTGTVYGYWVVVDGKDSSSWIAYASSGDTQPKQIVMSHGDPSLTVTLASYFKVQTAGNWNPLNPGF